MEPAPIQINISALSEALLSSQSWWDDMGVDCDAVPVPKARPKPSKHAPQNLGQKQTPNKPQQQAAPKLTKPLSPNPSSQQHDQERLALAVSQAGAAPTLEALRAVMENFDAGVLSDNAANTLFSRGPVPQISAKKIMVIGETPSAEDDHADQLFSGERGDLLDKMLAAIGRSPEEFYCTAISPWRTPSERALTDEEMALCQPFLKRHIQLYAPDFLVLAGSGPLKALCGSTSIMKAQGQWQTVSIGDAKFQAMPLYPPQTLLQRPAMKKQAWRSLLTLRANLDQG